MTTFFGMTDQLVQTLTYQIGSGYTGMQFPIYRTIRMKSAHKFILSNTVNAGR